MKDNKFIKNLWWVAVYAIAMAYVESAVVVYLRRLGNIFDLTLSAPFFEPRIGVIEVGREAATLVMLLAVAWIAGRKFQSRIGHLLFAFGVWDIFYYLWLKVMIDWPATILEWDILFYIPLPWWGPVLAPVLISLLMIVSGVLLVVFESRQKVVHVRLADWLILLSGALLSLLTFMADALKALPADVQTLGMLRPTRFNWPVFAIGLALMAYASWRMLSRDQRSDSIPSQSN